MNKQQSRVGNPSSDGARRTDRVQVEIPIEVVGEDVIRGRSFCQRGYTSVVSRHGAAIVLNYALTTDQELTIRCLDTKIEAEARVVGLIRSPGNDLVYGVMFLDTAANPWGIDFPTLTGDEGFGRICLQCRLCQAVKVFHLSEIEIQIFEANESIQQFCKNCSTTTSWRQGTGRAPQESRLPGDKRTQESIALERRVVNRRKHKRIRASVLACVREPRFPEEMVACEDLSRGGIRFRASKPYQKGARIEVAVPYSTGNGNIFVPAQIVHVEDCGHFFRVGAAYVETSRKREGFDGYSGSSILPFTTNS